MRMCVCCSEYYCLAENKHICMTWEDGERLSLMHYTSVVFCARQGVCSSEIPPFPYHLLFYTATHPILSMQGTIPRLKPKDPNVSKTSSTTSRFFGLCSPSSDERTIEVPCDVCDLYSVCMCVHLSFSPTHSFSISLLSRVSHSVNSPLCLCFVSYSVLNLEAISTSFDDVLHCMFSCL